MILKMSQSNENDCYANSCQYCGRRFSQHKAVYLHMRRFHKDKPIIFKNKRKIICVVCEEKIPSMKVYWNHISLKHPEMKLSFEKKFFYSEEEFDKWKKEMEEQTHTHFTQATSTYTLRDGRVTTQIQCDRSGRYVPSGSGIRKVMSKKIGKFCPAYMYRTKTVEGDLMEIEVNFQSTHAGHDFLNSLRMRSEERERRLKSQGKRIQLKKDLPPPTPNENVQNGYNNGNLVEITNPSMSKMSDHLINDPNIQTQQVLCSCDQYSSESSCKHVQALLKSLNSMRSLQENNDADENRKSVDYLFADADPTPHVEENFVNTVENSDIKHLEDEKVAVVEEFQQVLSLCQNRKHLDILKEFISESKKHLLSTLTYEQNDSCLSANINNEQYMPSIFNIQSFVSQHIEL